MLPCLYAFLPNKQTSTYVALLRIIQDFCLEHNITFNPGCIHIDFEQSMIAAIRSVFQAGTIRGCTFHFGQCIWRNAQNFGLLKQSRNLDQIDRCLKMLTTLPMIKPWEIDSAYQYIIAQAPQDMSGFMVYFESNFIANNARFPRTLWNHYGSIAPWTSNHVEVFIIVLKDHTSRRNYGYLSSTS